jgi:hypothetical protein
VKLVVLAALASATPAHAELPTIDSVIEPRIVIGGVTDVADERGDIIWLSFQTPRSTARPITLDVPRGTLAVGIMVGDSVWGAPVTAEHDLSIVEQNPGAVLSWSSASGDVEHLVLAHEARDCSGTDVVVRCSERVTIALVLPMIDHVQIFPQPARIDGKPAKSGKLALPPPHELGIVPPHVDVNTSLAVVSTLPVTIRIAPQAQVWHDVDKNMIRRRLEWRHDSLRWCYQRVAQYKRGLAGTLVAQFSITREGAIEDVSVDGDLDNDDIKSCIARELSVMEFPESDTRVRVNYPLTFKQDD